MHRSSLRGAVPLDPAAAGPPLEGVPGHDGMYTVRPLLSPPSGLDPRISSGVAERVRRFLDRQRRESLRIRETLSRHRGHLRAIVGGENILFSPAARLGASTDSTGLRGLMTEAVFLPPDLDSLRTLVAWCFRHRIPMIPYGAGSGYNMGVVPLVPAVTIWLACLSNVETPGPAAGEGGAGRMRIVAEAGATYDEVVAMARRHGFVLRCVPNSPRAAVGGIVATGSNGGRRIGEIVIGGEALLADGTLVRFSSTAQERDHWERDPFPLVHKFHGVGDPSILRHEIVGGSSLPASLFVGSEGTTGIITKVELEVERPSPLSLTLGVWLARLEDAVPFVRGVRAGETRPVYFELLTQPAIGRYLASDFPDLFPGTEQAYLVLTLEGPEDTLLEAARRIARLVPQDGRWVSSGPYPTAHLPAQARRLIAPREELPKKLVSKCKSDVEVILDALPRVIPHLASACTASGEEVESVLFGHLTGRTSAILHWNIGGVDVAVEESAAAGWRHIEHVLETLRGQGGGVAFTGEHGAAGRPWLFHASLPRDEVARLYRIKRAVDPRGLLNPKKLFLPSRIDKALRGRALAQCLDDPGVAHLRSRCTRCNACQNCPVLDAQVALRARRRPRPSGRIIVGKRSMLHALEVLATASMDPRDRLWFLEEVSRAARDCIACGRCDAACPVGITLDDVARVVPGGIRRGTVLSSLLHRLFLAPSPRGLTMWVASRLQRLFQPLSSIPVPPLASYAALPPIDWRRYAPVRSSPSGVSQDLRVIGPAEALVRDGALLIRFRGCAGTRGQAQATVHEDEFFASRGVPFLDFVPDLCCGFPQAAEDDPRAAGARRRALLSRILGAAQRATEAWGAERVTLMSSCPTCQESLRGALSEERPPVPVEVLDPAEVLVPLLPPRRAPRTRIGLKVPCHATPTSVAAQVCLLERLGFEPVPLDLCCGMAGTARLAHPELCLVIAQKLASAISHLGLTVLVSSCPSCRDGLRLQAALERTGWDVRDPFDLEDLA